MGVGIRQRVRFRRDLAAIKREDVKVVKHLGYTFRGRPGGLKARGVIVHHDASARGPSQSILSLLKKGRADLSGPLYNFWIGRDGRVHVLAAGRANHAGSGSASWLDQDAGNGDTYGICLDLTSGEDMPKKQQVALTRLTAALLARRGRHAVRMIGHKEYSDEGKVDPAISMVKARKRVNKRIRTLRRTKPWFANRWARVRWERGQKP